ncbi:hypothetical protein LTR53_010964 [Teratosphaeriaceae sp. CCFEE 6253]|nr:hypothetical protein LTR53_010964 [Teratosphaeriaceae sp. CCFEE 6253]
MPVNTASASQVHGQGHDRRIGPAVLDECRGDRGAPRLYHQRSRCRAVQLTPRFDLLVPSSCVSFDLEGCQHNGAQHVGSISGADDQGKTVWDTYADHGGYGTREAYINGLPPKRMKLGVQGSDLAPWNGAQPIKEVIQNFIDLAVDRVVVFHDAKSDRLMLDTSARMCSMVIPWGRITIRDTQKYTGFWEAVAREFEKTVYHPGPSLKDLATIYLPEMSLQADEHRSLPDAIATMRLYQMYQAEIEAEYAARAAVQVAVAQLALPPASNTQDTSSGSDSDGTPEAISQYSRGEAIGDAFDASEVDRLMSSVHLASTPNVLAAGKSALPPITSVSKPVTPIRSWAQIAKNSAWHCDDNGRDSMQLETVLCWASSVPRCPRERAGDTRPGSVLILLSRQPTQEVNANFIDLAVGRTVVFHDYGADRRTLDASARMCGITVPRASIEIRDTQKYLSYWSPNSQQPGPSLRCVAKELLGIDIQVKAHTSFEDAVVTMQLYKLNQAAIEASHAPAPAPVVATPAVTDVESGEESTQSTHSTSPSPNTPTTGTSATAFDFETGSISGLQRAVLGIQPAPGLKASADPQAATSCPREQAPGASNAGVTSADENVPVPAVEYPLNSIKKAGSPGVDLGAATRSKPFFPIPASHGFSWAQVARGTVKK